MRKPKTEALVFWGLIALQGGFVVLNLPLARLSYLKHEPVSFSVFLTIFTAGSMALQLALRRKKQRLVARMQAATHEQQRIEAEIVQNLHSLSPESEARAKVYLERIVAVTGAKPCDCGCGGYFLGKVFVYPHGHGAVSADLQRSTCIDFSEPIPISERVASILLILHNQPEEFDRWHAEMIGQLPQFSTVGPN